MKLKKIHFNTYQPTYIFLDWIKAPIIKSVANETLLVTYFPDFPGYEQHIHVRTTSLGNYYFVKYMDYGQNVDDCNLLNHFYFLYFFDFRLYSKIKQRDVNCSKLATDQNQESKPFSWQEAFLLCHSINATLPEFYNRKEQEEFIAVLKSGDIFPIEAVFLELHRKVGLYFIYSLITSHVYGMLYHHQQKPQHLIPAGNNKKNTLKNALERIFF